MPGGQIGKKPGRVEGSVEMSFAETNDPSLSAELRAHVERQRVTEPATFDLEIDDAASSRIEQCQIGGYFGGGSGLSGGWFGLSSSNL